ncbi:TetR/AcrR family transcriptional regulator [Actinomadura sp. RB99]|uniref:TetR/AcrR family transcriptional regulator n=1 Tax=Actinomadura sp. RB99 TaxID=2691577 RepID=UPI0019D519F9|nr:TetR/AcrR family transcriptional regulator [Actinomadura sp. RB99]
MTSRQLVRRARLIEAVTEIVQEVGPQNLQMREVAERSGVGTAYRYFRSREHLMAAALAEWQEELTRRVLGRSHAADEDPSSMAIDYYRRALRVFYRSPRTAETMIQMIASTDPDVIGVLDQMGSASSAVLERLLAAVAPEQAPYVQITLDSVLTTCVTDLVTGRAGLEEATRRMEGVTRLVMEKAEAAG